MPECRLINHCHQKTAHRNLLDSEQAGRVKQQWHKSGQVLPGDEIIEIDGVQIRRSAAAGRQQIARLAALAVR
jgi:hypothetical protein